jgi:hypothetical protein
VRAALIGPNQKTTVMGREGDGFVVLVFVSVQQAR